MRNKVNKDRLHSLLNATSIISISFHAKRHIFLYDFESYPKYLSNLGKTYFSLGLSLCLRLQVQNVNEINF